MPWYDYKCPNCEHEELDIQRSIKENVSEMECPECKTMMKQLIGNTAFKLSGSGWFKTGYSKVTETKKKE